MGFQTPQYKLSDLLKRVEDGRIQLPDFQRGYKWDDERIRSLLVTITLAHPLGVIMLLQTGNDQVRFKPKPLAGSDKTATNDPDHLLLDGQQRLTSLFQALTGDGVVATKDVRGKLMNRRYYLDLALAVSDSARRDEAVLSLPADGVIRSEFGRKVELDVSTPDKERERRLFPFRLISDQTAATQWLLQLNDNDLFSRFLGEVLSPTQNYEIPAIELDKSTSKAAVATVFEKVNTGGLSLNVFELLTATFAGDKAYFEQHGTDFRLNDDWTVTQAQFVKHPVLAGVASTDFLQAVTLLTTRARNIADTSDRPVAISARKEDVFRLELTDYLQWVDPLREAFVWASTFLADQHIHEAAFLPYRTQLVPLAVIRVVLGNDADLVGVRKRIRQWYWCGVLGELYGGAVETRFARDVEQVPSWALAAVSEEVRHSVPRTVADGTFVESRLLSLRTRNAAAYKGIYALLMAGGCRDWKYQQAFDQVQYASLAVDIHHVFPRAWCERNGIDPSLRESIVNKTPLAASTNRFIGAASPADYLPKLEKSAGMSPEELDDILVTHEIDPATLRSADFQAFFLARRSALLELVEGAMGKAAQRDVDASELLGGDEAPHEFDQTEGVDDLSDAVEEGAA
ncbi:GmrSD restriction endonuclease domain-containing protein [Kineococcus sp. SYSU DK004]|uniref:GmrSD restriction endonuclease domain-containing protein n=1 Tax=Kineococcus sp. SYSU DK004 TaxID=3383125 RepID=UPI003D7C8401